DEAAALGFLELASHCGGTAATWLYGEHDHREHLRREDLDYGMEGLRKTREGASHRDPAVPEVPAVARARSRPPRKNRSTARCYPSALVCPQAETRWFGQQIPAGRRLPALSSLGWGDHACSPAKFAAFHSLRSLAEHKCKGCARTHRRAAPRACL